MNRFDIFVIMLVVYLGLSAWAYRGVGIKRTRTAEVEPALTPSKKRSHASYWQIVSSGLAFCLGVVLITGGAGLMIRGLFGTADWVVLTLGAGFPVNDVVTGLILAVLGALMVYETRYSIIKHPRPPRKFTKRLV